jgi:hypothetical protein
VREIGNIKANEKNTHSGFGRFRSSVCHHRLFHHLGFGEVSSSSYILADLAVLGIGMVAWRRNLLRKKINAKVGNLAEEGLR